MSQITKFSISILISFGIGLLYSVHIEPLPKIGPFFNPFSGFFQNAERKEFSDDIIISENSVHKIEATVAYDSFRIPHIYAKNSFSKNFALGYTVARDRLWQMDIMSRVASGRVSEVFGARALNFDRKQRRIGMGLGAKNKLKKALDNEVSKTFLISFSAGVNEYIKTLEKEKLPFEYKLLGYKPELWTPLKSLYIFMYMSYDLCYSETDISNNLLLQALGKEVFDIIQPENPAYSLPVIRDKKFSYIDSISSLQEVDFQNIFTADLEVIKEKKEKSEHAFYERSNNPFETNALGSNNWVVHGSKSNTKMPILSNDPHLSFSLPAIWYAVHIHDEKSNVFGVTIPGMPGVVIGANNKTSWGFTNTGLDVTDWFAIKESDNKTQYFIDDNWTDYEIVIEEIRIKNEDSFYDTVKYTKHGPVVYDHSFNPHLFNKPLALHWVAHDASEELYALYKINIGRSIKDFKKGLKYYSSPLQNAVFSDVTGNIGIFTSGRIPVRFPKHGKFVMDGTRSDLLWKEYIPYLQNPKEVNPKSERLYSANQQTTTTKYPYYHSTFKSHFSFSRAERIQEMFDEIDIHSKETAAQMQADIVSPVTRDWAKKLLEKLENSELEASEKKWYHSIKKWDYSYSANSQVPSLIERFIDTFIVTLWDEINTISPLIDFPARRITLELLKTNKIESFYDILSTEKKESLNDLFEHSFKVAVKEFEKKPLAWGQQNGVDIWHITKIKELSEVDLSLSGCGGCPSAMKTNKKGTNTSGPSWKMITTYKNGKSVMKGIYPGGQSGNPGSYYYKTFIDKWKSGKYIDINSPENKEDAMEKATHIIQFK